MQIMFLTDVAGMTVCRDSTIMPPRFKQVFLPPFEIHYKRLWNVGQTSVASGSVPIVDMLVDCKDAERVVLWRWGTWHSLGAWPFHAVFFLLRLEPIVHLLLDRLAHGWRRVGKVRPRSAGPTLRTPLHPLDDRDPQAVDHDLHQLNDAQDRAAHPEPKLSAQIGGKPVDLELGEAFS